MRRNVPSSHRRHVIRQLVCTILIVLVLVRAGGAFASPDAPPPCDQTSATTFVIDGPLDQALAECVNARLKDTARELVVTSGGGDISSAIDIAERLAPLQLLLRVRENCDSSCGMFSMPVARRIELEPGAYMLAYGSADPALVKTAFVEQRAKRSRDIQSEHPAFSRQDAEAYFDTVVEKARKQAAMQEAFRERHHVGRGRYIYREGSDGEFRAYLQGEPGPPPHVFGYRFLLVEEPMLRSCLPDVDVAPFQRDLEANVIANRPRRRNVQKAGVRRSSQLRCTVAARAGTQADT